ncbi:hypothetical protein COLO4_03941 [Corchorus olitorius]|uniref:Uncharacterized protein n=1 Tax=Corchorus olitorius TaxID=93759 RepID=A0A1R3KVX2_9ROSI|nr:hypothetical protein COLO4_03941 [Corchorus olitorius]
MAHQWNLSVNFNCKSKVSSFAEQHLRRGKK